MKRLPALAIPALLSLGIHGCDPGALGGDDGAGGKADDPDGEGDAGDGNLCMTETVASLPPPDALGFPGEPCLLWNAGEPVPTGDDQIPFNNEDVVVVSHDNLEALTIAQLRLTIAYFASMDTSLMTVAELIEAGEGPLFSLVVDRRTGRAYDGINIALGDTPMDLLFRHGTLDPVVVVSDGDLQLCRID
jgi:hypothetical protein